MLIYQSILSFYGFELSLHRTILTENPPIKALLKLSRNDNPFSVYEIVERFTNGLLITLSPYCSMPPGGRKRYRSTDARTLKESTANSINN